MSPPSTNFHYTSLLARCKFWAAKNYGVEGILKLILGLVQGSLGIWAHILYAILSHCMTTYCGWVSFQLKMIPSIS